MNPRTLFLAGIAVTVFLGVSLIVYAAARAPAPPGTRSGLRGLKRQRALAKGGAWAFVEPFVRWLGLRVSGLVSGPLRTSIDRQVSMAGGYLGLLAEEVVALSILSTVGGLVFGILFTAVAKTGTAFFLAVTAFGAVAPSLWLSSAAKERAVSISRRLPDAVDLLALSMSAGLDFPGALRQAVDRSGTPDDPLIEELALVLQSLQFGRTRREALEEFAERAPIETVREFVGAVVQAELRGNPLSDVLRIQAQVSRQHRSVRAEEAAAKAAVALNAPLAMVLVAIIILIAGPIAIGVMASGL
jgi:tight adherence protein C